MFAALAASGRSLEGWFGRVVIWGKGGDLGEGW